MTREQELTRCAGYRAPCPARAPTAAVSLVHSGQIYRRLAAVSFDQVETIDADEERVLIRWTRAAMQEGARGRARNQILPRA
jgi:hypothetical protein